MEGLLSTGPTRLVLIYNKNSFGTRKANLTPWRMIEMAVKETVDLLIALPLRPFMPDGTPATYNEKWS